MTFPLFAFVTSAKVAGRIATKNNDLKSSLIFNEFGELLKTYTNKEFAKFSSIHISGAFDNELSTKENFLNLFTKLRSELENQNDCKYIDMKKLLSDMTKTEENNLVDVYILALKSPKEDYIDYLNRT